MLKRREYLEKAEELEKEGKIEEAIQLLEECKENYPEYVLARLLLAKYYYRLENLERAQEELEFVVKESPDSIIAFTLLGEIAEKKGEYEKAREHFIRVKFLNPFNTEIDEKLLNLEKLIKEKREMGELEQVAEMPEQEIPVEETESSKEEPQQELLPESSFMHEGVASEDEKITLPEVFPELEEEEQPEAEPVRDALFETPTMAEILALQGEGEEAEKIIKKLYEKTGDEKYKRKLNKIKLMKKLHRLLEAIERRR